MSHWWTVWIIYIKIQIWFLVISHTKALENVNININNNISNVLFLQGLFNEFLTVCHCLVTSYSSLLHNLIKLSNSLNPRININTGFNAILPSQGNQCHWLIANTWNWNKRQHQANISNFIINRVHFYSI